jgi:O-antigen/teichoic acid export membrane protein
VVIGAGIASIPLTIHYLGPERFGIWMTLSSLTSVLRIADVGIASGLISRISAACSVDESRELLSSALAAIAALVGALTLLVLGAFLFLPWGQLVGATSALGQSEARWAFLAMAVVILIDLVAGTTRSVNHGLQRGYLNSIWRSLGTLAGLGLLVVGTRLGVGLPALLLLYSGTPLLGEFMNSRQIFREFPPSVRLVTWHCVRSIAGTGVWFFVMQLAIAAREVIPRFAISQTLGAQAVTPYAIVESLFAYGLLATSLIVQPLWPAYSEALSKGELSWVRRTLRRTLRITLVVIAVVLFPLCVFGGAVTERLAHVEVSGTLVWTLGFMYMAYSIGACYSTVLNGANAIRPQAVNMVIRLGVVAAMIYPAIHWAGVNGVALTMLVSYLLTSLWFMPFMAYRLLPKAKVPAIADAVLPRTGVTQ